MKMGLPPLESGLASAVFRFKSRPPDDCSHRMSSRSANAANARLKLAAKRAAAVRDHASSLVAEPSVSDHADHGDHASLLVAGPPLPQWSCPNKARAAEHFLMKGSTSSLRNEARTHKVDRNWCDRFLAAAAQLGRSRHNIAFAELVDGLDGCRPIAIYLQRAYDETGRICRTQAMTPDGQLATSTETAKLMSGKLTFAIVLEWAGVVHVIQGALPTLIVPMANQTAPIVAE